MGKIRDGLIKAGCIGLIAGGVATFGVGVKNGVESQKLQTELDSVQMQKETAMHEVITRDEYISYYYDELKHAHNQYQSGVINRSEFDKMTDQENVVKTYLAQNDQENELVGLLKQETDLKTEIANKTLDFMGGYFGSMVLGAIGTGGLAVNAALNKNRKTDESDEQDAPEECLTE